MKMTYEKAKYFLHPDTTKQALRGLYRDEAIEVVDEACIVACEALDKQVAKKPNAARCGDYACPSCGNTVGEVVGIAIRYLVKDEFCKYCGQKLDWNDNGSQNG